MPTKTVVIPTGFVEVLIEVQDVANLAFVRAYANYLRQSENSTEVSVAVGIGTAETLVLCPGKYRIRVVLGDIASGYEDIEVKPGQKERIVFKFGKS